MRLNGGACAAAALAVSVSCGGSLPPPSTQPAPPHRAAPAPAAAPGVDIPSPAPPAATASLAGVVVNAVTRRPLSRARVILSSAALSEPRAAITRTDGAYTFRQLPAGAYGIAVTRTGFAPQRFGEGRSTPPASVALAVGEQVSGIEVALAPAGVIVGQILDEDHQPFAGGRVEALVSRSERGQSTLVPVASAESDDRGHFRLTGLPAGQYYVSAFDPAFANIGDETGALTYTATYYPGTPHPDEASRVTVVPGVEPALKIVFGLRIIRPARVSGTLSTLDRRQLINGAVIMSPVHGQGLAMATQDVTILPDGGFAFRNVPPGRYRLHARGEVEPQDVALFAAFTVAVEGRDVSDLEMTLSPGASIEGSLVVEAVSSPRPASYAGIRVRAPLVDGAGFGDSPTGDVGHGGAFRIRGVMAGRHYVTVEGLPDPWVLKRVVYRGQDVTDTALDLQSTQALKDVTVVIADVATDLSGIVTDGGGLEAPDALVLIVPASPQLWTSTSRSFRVLRTDAHGRYRIRGLPAGQYRALASHDLDERDVYRRGVVEDVVPLAEPFGLDDGARRTLDLRLVSLAARRTGSR